MAAPHLDNVGKDTYEFNPTVPKNPWMVQLEGFGTFMQKSNDMLKSVHGHGLHRAPTILIRDEIKHTPDHVV